MNINGSFVASLLSFGTVSEIVEQTKNTSQVNLTNPEAFKDSQEISNVAFGSVPTESVFSNIVKPEALPPINIEKDGPFTFMRNAYGQGLTLYTKDDGSKLYSFSFENGLSISLKDNPDKRDTLVFSNMSDIIPKNSQIPNDYFHIGGDTGESKAYFDENHNIVIELSNNDKLVFDGSSGQFLEGPFNFKFDPNNTKTGFIDYNGSNSVKKYKSYGDNVRW